MSDGTIATLYTAESAKFKMPANMPNQESTFTQLADEWIVAPNAEEADRQNVRDDEFKVPDMASALYMQKQFVEKGVSCQVYRVHTVRIRSAFSWMKAPAVPAEPPSSSFPHLPRISAS